MSIIKVLLVSLILLVLALSGMFFKILFTKQGNKHSGNNSLSDQGLGCGCGSGACCKTSS